MSGQPQTTLLPCPFCGSSDAIAVTEGGDDDWIVACRNCGANIGYVDITQGGRDAAITRWNLRNG